MLIAAISDTHITDKTRMLPAPLVDRLRTVDMILHAGDFTTLATLNFLRSLAPTEAVYGNVDEAIVKATLPRTQVVEVVGLRIGLVHGDGVGTSTPERARRAFDRVDCIVFGHSHSPYLQDRDGVLMVNPGSPTDKRREPRPSYALLTVTDHIEAEIVYL